MTLTCDADCPHKDDCEFGHDAGRCLHALDVNCDLFTDHETVAPTVKRLTIDAPPRRTPRK